MEEPYADPDEAKTEVRWMLPGAGWADQATSLPFESTRARLRKPFGPSRIGLVGFEARGQANRGIPSLQRL